jgi:hypothetical protein
VTRERFLELQKSAEQRALTRVEAIALLAAVDSLQIEMLTARNALYAALDAHVDDETEALSLVELIERLELDIDVEYEQRIEAERQLRSMGVSEK